MIIKNKGELSISALRQAALHIIEAGINGALPSTIMPRSLKFKPSPKTLIIDSTHYLIPKGRIFVIGGGKAAGLMAETLEKILSPATITYGVVNCLTKAYDTNKIKIIAAAHPTPDRRGVKGVERMLNLKDQYAINENDLIICLLSGGASAMLPSPVDGITLKDKQHITTQLIKSGAEIHEINALRKHLSKIKGGRMGRFFSPAKVLSLILSDVIGNDLDVIASGPTAPDSSTFPEALAVLKKYNLLAAAPPRVVAYILKGCRGEVPETPKEVDNCYNHIIGENRTALAAMAVKAKELGFKPYILTSVQKGDPTAAAKAMAKKIRSGLYQDYDVILTGGETTPRLPEKPGKGGRNRHFAAVSLTELKKYSGDWVMASIGTDGADYLKDAAGAIVDKMSAAKVISKKIDMQSYLDRYDSCTLLKKIGNSLIRTGPTGTNVNDVALYIFKKSSG
jgi:glycerate-2-kinase